MNRIDLQRRLREENVDESSYSLEGGFPSERYVLSNEGNVWLVYYSERGLMTNLHTFQTESDACLHLLQQILSDRTTKKHHL
jgi:hypothetical protein